MKYLPFGIIAFFIACLLLSIKYLEDFLGKRACYSPFETVRRFNFLGFILSPILIQNWILDILSLLILFSYVWKYKIIVGNTTTEYCTFVLLSYGNFLLLSLISSCLLFYGIGSNSLWISHLFHDCSAGVFHLTLPTTLWLMSRKNVKPSSTFIPFLLTILGLAMLNIRLYPANLLPSILCLISGNLTLLYLEHPESKKLISQVLPKTINNNCDSETFQSVNFSLIYRAVCISILASVLFLLVPTILSTKNLITDPCVFSSTEYPRLSIGIPTLVRKYNPRYLSATVESLLEQFPHNVSHPIYSKRLHRIFPISYDNKSTSNVVFDGLETMMAKNYVSAKYVTFVSGQEALNLLPNLKGINQTIVLPQRIHVSATLLYLMSKTPRSTPTTPSWIMILEDDFQLCPNKWNWFLRTLLNSKDNHCALFVATGGAGLVVRHEIIPSLVKALLNPTINLPTDIIMQQCLRGFLPGYCQECHCSKLGISSHLIFRHIGFISSLEHTYIEEEARWPCDWSHPFNGDPDVHIFHTDT